MVSKKHKNLAENLKNLRKARQLTLAEFSRELGIPKSTLQSILEDGQTSLDTAIRISEKLSIPLDTLTNGTLSVRQLEALDDILFRPTWFYLLSEKEQNEAADHIHALLRLLQKSRVHPYSSGQSDSHSIL